MKKEGSVFTHIQENIKDFAELKETTSQLLEYMKNKDVNKIMKEMKCPCIGAQIHIYEKNMKEEGRVLTFVQGGVKNYTELKRIISLFLNSPHTTEVIEKMKFSNAEFHFEIFDTNS